jgi:transcriptional regulator with XRE-family HTH domain
MVTTIRFGARLRAARKAAGFKTSKDFLKKYKVPASTYSQHESGSRSPNDTMLEFYSEVFGVNLNWLKTGDGKPYSRINIAKKTIISEELIDLNQAKIIHPLNQKLLTKILEELLQNSRSLSVKKIAHTAVKKYAELAFSSK